MCLGGPLDGQWWTHAEPTFEVPELGLPMPVIGEIPQLNESYKVRHYRYVADQIRFPAGDGITFWRLENENCRLAMERLFRNYRMNRR